MPRCVWGTLEVETRLGQYRNVTEGTQEDVARFYLCQNASEGLWETAKDFNWTAGVLAET
jgi:hypothetical protein